jgi:hypothetical protein
MTQCRANRGPARMRDHDLRVPALRSRLKALPRRLTGAVPYAASLHGKHADARQAGWAAAHGSLYSRATLNSAYLEVRTPPPWCHLVALEGRCATCCSCWRLTRPSACSVGCTLILPSQVVTCCMPDWAAARKGHAAPTAEG